VTAAADVWHECPDDCEVCEPYFEEHTDRMARYLDEDDDTAAINAEMDGLA